MSTIITLMCYRILQVISVSYTLIAYKHFYLHAWIPIPGVWQT